MEVEEVTVGLPQDYELSNYPNPFNSTTTLCYRLPISCYISLRICDIYGKLIRTLVEGERPAGYHSVRWDGRDDSDRPVASGVYLYRLRVGTFVRTGKMALIR